MTLLQDYVDLRSGVHVMRYRDARGDVWERTGQLAFVENGKLTPLGRLADFMNRG
jgi:hypothetical protein